MLVPAAVTEDLDFSRLPDELRHLAPLIARYSESDDVERSELLEQASDDELGELSEAPQAHWKSINAFLDQNVEAEPGPTQDVALALDSFAQAAMEAKLTLDARADR
jgi:cell division protein FtsI/penicillin-binding protein 2